LGAISETSDLIPAGQQIGEAELLLPKLKMKNSKQIDKLEAPKSPTRQKTR
jgi:methionyl-tRNA synthetase